MDEVASVSKRKLLLRYVTADCFLEREIELDTFLTLCSNCTMFLKENKFKLYNVLVGSQILTRLIILCGGGRTFSRQNVCCPWMTVSSE
jgi:hypothetical protein